MDIGAAALPGVSAALHARDRRVADRVVPTRLLDGTSDTTDSPRRAVQVPGSVSMASFVCSPESVAGPAESPSAVVHRDCLPPQAGAELTSNRLGTDLLTILKATSTEDGANGR